MTTMFDVFSKEGLLVELADESEKQDGSKMHLHISDNSFDKGTLWTEQPMSLQEVVAMSLSMLALAFTVMHEGDFADAMREWEEKDHSGVLDWITN
jgi:hypothetical protein